MSDFWSGSNDTYRDGPSIKVTHSNTYNSPFRCSQQFCDHGGLWWWCYHPQRIFLLWQGLLPNLAENIGAAIGQCIALVHEWSRSNPDGILDTFDNSLHAKRTIADLNYDRLVATLQHCDKDDLPLLSDLEIPPSDIQTISEIIDEYHTHLMSPWVPGQDVVGPFFSRGDLFSREA